MRFLTLPTLLASALLLPTFVNAFVVKVWQNDNCAGEPDYIVDRGSDGDCEWFEGGASFKYYSDTGCFLSTWLVHSPASILRPGICPRA